MLNLEIGSSVFKITVNKDFENKGLISVVEYFIREITPSNSTIYYHLEDKDGSKEVLFNPERRLPPTKGVLDFGNVFYAFSFEELENQLESIWSILKEYAQNHLILLNEEIESLNYSDYVQEKVVALPELMELIQSCSCSLQEQGYDIRKLFVRVNISFSLSNTDIKDKKALYVSLDTVMLEDLTIEEVEEEYELNDYSAFLDVLDPENPLKVARMIRIDTTDFSEGYDSYHFYENEDYSTLKNYKQYVYNFDYIGFISAIDLTEDILKREILFHRNSLDSVFKEKFNKHKILYNITSGSMYSGITQTFLD